MKKNNYWTISDIVKLHEDGKILGYTVMNKPCNPLNPTGEPAKESKYGNKRVSIDNISFMSKKEANRYVDLKRLFAAGIISDLKLQVCYELNHGGTHSYKYIADFVYMENGQQVVEDAKGFRTAVYRKKAKLMLKVHGITILET